MAEYRELDHDGRAAFDATIRTSHRMRTIVKVYNRNEKDPEVLDGNVVAGQVDCDLSNDITRSLTLTVADPRRRFLFDPIGPVYADNFIGVEYSVYVPDLGEWVDVPVFFGPVSRYARDGDEVTLEAVGKEALLLPPVKQVIPTAPPADRLLNVVLREMAEGFGEERFRLGLGRGKKVPGSFSVDPTKAREGGTWRYMQLLAKSRNMRLLYTGDGYLELRRLNPASHAVWEFRDALSEPAVSYDLTEARNRVEVRDQDKKGHPDPLVRLDLAASHPLSKESLARNGTDRILLERVDVDEVKMTLAEGTRLAEGVLRRHSQGVLEVAFDHPPVPHLNLGDRVRIVTDTLDETFQLKSFTIPLTPDSMSVGYTRPIKLVRKLKYRRRRI